MDLIKSVSRRSRLSEAAHVALNLIYAAVIWYLVTTFDPPYIAFGVVLLSKWRVFAVRPRFWFANLQANLVDALFALSVVTLLWVNNNNFEVQFLLTVVFAAWLVIIKPRSKQRFMLIQAGLSQFISLTALFSFSYAIPSVLMVILCWIIGYATARHVLSAYNSESDRVFLALLWGFIVAELGWLGYHWTVAYGLDATFKVPQMALIVTLLAFIVAKVYDQYHHHDGRINLKVLRWPLLFVVITISLLLVRFNGLNPS